MIDWTIGFLNGLKELDQLGQFLFVLTLIGPFAGLYAFMRLKANRRFAMSLTSQSTMQEQLEEANTACDTLKALHEKQDAELDALEQRLPERFLATLERELAEGNDDLATRACYAYLEDNRDALFAAFSHLTRQEMLASMADLPAKDRAALLSLARDNARLALAVNPDDAEMATYEEELAAAAAAAEQGLGVKLADASLRELRWRSRDTLPASYDALIKVFYDSRDKGRYRTARIAAREALRLARRSGGENSPEAFIAARCEAEAEKFLGNADKALRQLTKLRDAPTCPFGPEDDDFLALRHLIASCLADQADYEAALMEARAVHAIQELPDKLGPEHPDTLATRHLIARCLSEQGEYEAALKDARAVRAIQERPDFLGPEHPHTLVTRQLIAYCLADQGEYEAALMDARAVHAIQERPDKLGPEHPHTLATRRLIADILIRLGQWQEAREVFDGVLAGYEAAGLNPSHSLVKRAKATQARLEQ